GSGPARLGYARRPAGGSPGGGHRVVRRLHPADARRRGALQAPRGARDPRRPRLRRGPRPLDREPRTARAGAAALARASVAHSRRHTGGDLHPHRLVPSRLNGRRPRGALQLAVDLTQNTARRTLTGETRIVHRGPTTTVVEAAGPRLSAADRHTHGNPAGAGAPAGR